MGHRDGGLTIVDVIGMVVFVVGFLFEAVGDAQLSAFKGNPANKGVVMDRGLWRYTRHPNYFGEFVLWWGIGLVALSTRGAWWAALLGPSIISFLLLRVSGVPLLEKSLQTRRPGYDAYIARTSSFFPRRPKST
jgi:steroid 5-alpha reductase family enzyme